MPHDCDFSAAERCTILAVAKKSVAYGAQHNRPMIVDSALYPHHLQQTAASFVTLHIEDQLRGCIGQLEATMPVINDVAQHAYAAAFSDPRFLPVKKIEIDKLVYHISILGAKTPIQFQSEVDLLQQLQPTKDGLVLRDGNRYGTFLPSVWASLPEPELFLAQLKIKAGLPSDYWSDDVKIWRYSTISIP